MNDQPCANGKLNQVNQVDQGNLEVKIAYDKEKNVVVLNFGKPVQWIAFPPQTAVDFSALILEKARQSGQMITLDVGNTSIQY